MKTSTIKPLSLFFPQRFSRFVFRYVSPPLFLGFTLLLLEGCAAMRPGAPPTADLLSDSSFGAPAERIDADDLFTLSAAMRSYLHSAEFTAQLRSRGTEHGMVDALYKKGQLKLDYDASTTRNAAQTFEARAGNCLSLVIMTAAFAKELGMTVRYQDVAVGESWSRAGGLYISSSHVNLSFGRRASGLSRDDAASRMLTIDFLPPEDLAGYRTRPLDEDTIVAMYMNNRAAEALAGHRLDDAYWWARGAITQHPSFVTAYNTLGVVYQRHGNAQMAERVFRGALEREPENIVVMQNLVPVLAALGKNAESQALARRVASIDPTPPFHFFDRGMAAMAKADYATAKALFAREVRRAPYNHEFHFWLAIANLRLGEATQAREELALAVETSTTRDTRELYSAKLAHLRQLDRRLR
jgi:Tfp pilus assembly protein PilF